MPMLGSNMVEISGFGVRHRERTGCRANALNI
jgi:hypothetical protein